MQAPSTSHQHVLAMIGTDTAGRIIDFAKALESREDDGIADKIQAPVV
jgi:hypothetical protein